MYSLPSAITGDQDAYWSSTLLFVSFVTTPVTESKTKISMSPSRSLWKSSFEPSGDQYGVQSSLEEFTPAVIFTVAPSFTFTDQMHRCVVPLRLAKYRSPLAPGYAACAGKAVSDRAPARIVTRVLR